MVDTFIVFQRELPRQCILTSRPLKLQHFYLRATAQNQLREHNRMLLTDSTVTGSLPCKPCKSQRFTNPLKREVLRAFPARMDISRLEMIWSGTYANSGKDFCMWSRLASGIISLSLVDTHFLRFGCFQR